MCSKYNHAYETIKPLLEQRGIKIDTHAGPKKLSKEICQINPLDGTIIRIYPSISAAARDICPEGKSYKAITNHICRYKDTNTVSHGFLWKTRKELEENE